MEKTTLESLNTAYADATAAFLQATQSGRDHYRITLDSAMQAEARWLADPDNELLEKAAADAHAALVDERQALVKSIGGAKAVRTKKLDTIWTAAVGKKA